MIRDYSDLSTLSSFGGKNPFHSNFYHDDLASSIITPLRDSFAQTHSMAWNCDNSHHLFITYFYHVIPYISPQWGSEVTYNIFSSQQPWVCLGREYMTDSSLPASFHGTVWEFKPNLASSEFWQLRCTAYLYWALSKSSFFTFCILTCELTNVWQKNWFPKLPYMNMSVPAIQEFQYIY